MAKRTFFDIVKLTHCFHLLKPYRVRISHIDHPTYQSLVSHPYHQPMSETTVKNKQNVIIKRY